MFLSQLNTGTGLENNTSRYWDGRDGTRRRENVISKYSLAILGF